MNQEDYRSCMASGLKGKTGLSKDERKLLFCVQSRLCSGKAATPAEAEQICLNQPPKESKPRKSRGIDPALLAACVSETLVLEGLNSENLVPRLESSISLCKPGGKASPSSKPLTYKRFMNKCLKATDWLGDFTKAQPYIKKCQGEWDSIRAAQQQQGG